MRSTGLKKFRSTERYSGSIRVGALVLGALVPSSMLLMATALSQTHANRTPSKANKAQSKATSSTAGVLATAQAGFMRDVLPVVQKYCVGCHTGNNAEAGIDLSHYKDTASVLKDSDNWDRVVGAVSSGHMPPAGMPAPTKTQKDALVTWVQTTSSAAACQLHDPGHVTLRRLNRAEYNNTVRDLCGVDVRPGDEFPNDDVGYGFDNIGDVLSISPLLMEKYINAAEKMAHAAFQSPDEFIRPVVFDPARMIYISQSSNGGDAASLPTTNSEAGAEYDFPKDADYILRVVAYQDKAGTENAKMRMNLDGKEIAQFEVKNIKRMPSPYLIRQHVKAGKHRLSCVFLNDYYDDSEPNNPRKRNRDRNLYLKTVEIVGPLGTEASVSPMQKRLGNFEPEEGQRSAVARRFLSDFARRAYRRPVAKEEVDKLVRYVEIAAKQGETFQKGIELAMTATMCSPNFLFRVESYSIAPTKGGTAKPTLVKNAPSADQTLLNDFALASRLSYFLWSSMPDEELFTLAANGKLQDAEVLATQVKRMLKDPRARALSDNFAGQWLMLRSLANVSPDTKRFPTFNDHLRQCMRTETEMYFQNIVAQDRSVLEFLNSDYTFVNGTLAQHYGITGVEGEDFRKVKLTSESQRGGLLTQASLLTVTSNPTRTSPVKRGKFIMENIMGAKLPPAPAGVPPLADDKKGPLVGTLRQRMEQHRTNPTCASCHSRMDPIGFGLENFDAVGKWRTNDGESSIDPSGVLPDGAKFAGPGELKQIMLNRKNDFVRCLSEKLMTYALGRGISRTDKCTIDSMVQTAAKNNYKFSALVTAIVLSDPFRKQRGDTGA